MKTYLPIVLAAAIAVHASHLGLNAIELPKPLDLHETMPSEAALKLTSLGYSNLVADYYWLRAISHFGAKEMHAHAYPNLEPLIRRILALDPYFASAYKLAGTALTVRGQNFSASTELLKQGMQYRPNVWQIPFYLGFNAYHFEGDFQTAARAMSHAATLPGAPPVTGLLAARLAAEAGEPEIGLELIDTMLDTLDDEKLRVVYRERRKLLELELELEHLNLAVAAFRNQHGKNPEALDDLVSGGLVRGYPQHDPLGGSYYLGNDGLVHSTNDDKRLKIAPTALSTQSP